MIRTSIRAAISGEDFALIERWVAQPRVWKYLGPPFHGGRYTRAALAFATKTGTAVPFVALAGDEPAGVVALSDVVPEHRTANLWYALGEELLAGRGVMGQACGLMIDHAFTALGFHSLSAWAVSTNAASIRILEGNGFCRVGVRRESFLLDDQLVDTILYDQLHDEWQARRGR